MVVIVVVVGIGKMLIAMKRLIPEPRPYPFLSGSSRRITMSAATMSWMIRRRQTVL